jgi:hypothetical protein
MFGKKILKKETESKCYVENMKKPPATKHQDVPFWQRMNIS